MLNRQALRGKIEASITELQKSKKPPTFSMRKVSLLITWMMDRLHPEEICRWCRTRGVAATASAGAAVQRDRLEKGTNRNLTEFKTRRESPPIPQETQLQASVQTRDCLAGEQLGTNGPWGFWWAPN